MRNLLATLSILVLLAVVGVAANAAETVGKRPYEMVWAGRTTDTRPPLVDFENLDGWTVACREAIATWQRTREQQLWGRYVGKLVYRGTGSHASVTVRPAKPIPLTLPFDCVNLWVYGNNWAWAPDPTTPRVQVRVLLQSADGHGVTVDLGQVRWKEWFLMHRRLSDTQLATLGKAPRWVGIQIDRGRNAADRVLFFDNLAIYKESLPPLHFEPRRRRGIDLPAGQTTGTNTGPGHLPFPNRPETILPTNLIKDFQTHVEAVAGGREYELRYTGADGRLVYRYRPQTGMLDDVTAEWMGRGQSFQPLVGGGVYFADRQSTNIKPDKIELVDCQKEGATIRSTWRYRSIKTKQQALVTYTLRLWQKSLVIDVACTKPVIGEFRIGEVRGVDNARLVTLPYLTGESQRPAVLVTGPVDKPLFMLPLIDHCRSNASLLWFANQINNHGATQNGGSRYLTLTDGTRNPCFERLFLTVSPRFEEVLPNIPNPKSPWMHVAGQRVWRAHGASNRARDYAYWKKVARFGMKKVLITDHETGWRDGGESFTLRTRAAPGKGGDAGQVDYSRKLHALGFRYGIYNNYTDYAPVNEFWNEDYVTRTPDNQWRGAWARCYNLKPARAVELEARLAPIIQRKFHLDTAYCDVHTAVRPWSYCDFDARVPGAGTFAATFYAYGEIMLHQKATWNGPVYSEGNNHWYYCGLTDGNYGQDQVAHLAVNPWLVDFDLRKLHPLCCNFGMGNPGMFFGRSHQRRTPKDYEKRLDRFLAATLAFGHTGFLVFEGGFENAVRSYFSVQQVHARYAQQEVKSIRYANAEGELLDTSAAVASGDYRRSQIVVQYADGLEVWVNGNRSDTWKTPAAELPPNGWYVRDPRKKKIVAFSCLRDGHRIDYVESPAYRYANGRGRTTRFDTMTCDGQLVVLPRDDGTYEVIPVGACHVLGVSLDGHAATAKALDEAGKVVGPATTKWSRGQVFIEPVDKAVSYVLTPSAPPANRLSCTRQDAIPGETVVIKGREAHEVHVPDKLSPGTLWWYHTENAWIDFRIVPLADVELSLAAPNRFNLKLTPHVATATDAVVQLDATKRHVVLRPDQTQQIEFNRPPITSEGSKTVRLQVVAGSASIERQWQLKTERTRITLGIFPHQFSPGQCLRGEREMPLDPSTRASVRWAESACGHDRRQCLFTHPPYGHGTGYSFAVFGPFKLPTEPAAAFRCDIGKGDGSDPGDGILFRVVVIDSRGTPTTVAEKSWGRHAWTALTADLSRFRGQTIRLKLIADAGPKDNTIGDWACWSRLRIESLQPVLNTTVQD